MNGPRTYRRTVLHVVSRKLDTNYVVTFVNELLGKLIIVLESRKMETS